MSARLETIVASLDLGPGARVLERLDLGKRRFETIFAVRVGLFQREPERARRLAERWLAPGGTLRTFSDAPSRGQPGTGTRSAMPG